MLRQKAGFSAISTKPANRRAAPMLANDEPRTGLSG